MTFSECIEVLFEVFLAGCPSSAHALPVLVQLQIAFDFFPFSILVDESACLGEAAIHFLPNGIVRESVCLCDVTVHRLREVRARNKIEGLNVGRVPRLPETLIQPHGPIAITSGVTYKEIDGGHEEEGRRSPRRGRGIQCSDCLPANSRYAACHSRGQIQASGNVAGAGLSLAA